MPTPESAEQQFRARYGQEPTPYFQDTAFYELKRAMDHASDASNFTHSREGRLNRAKSAVSNLMPDGPAKIDEEVKPHWMSQSNWEDIILQRRGQLGYYAPGDPNSGPNFTRIAEAFADGDIEPFRAEFATAAQLLSEVSGIDLSFLNQFLFRDSYNWVEKMINRDDENRFERQLRADFRTSYQLSPDQVQLIQADTFVPPELCNPSVHRTGFVKSLSQSPG